MRPEADFIRYGVFGKPFYYSMYSFELWRTYYAQLIFASIGTLVIVFLLLHTASFAWAMIRPSKIQTYCHSITGSWALVTGASDGIGHAFSEELLERGFNVLLHGRNPEKLARIRKELADRFPRRTLDIVVADASKTDDGPQRVAEKVMQLPGKLTILINNVGGISVTPKYLSYLEVSAGAIDNLINTNLRFTALLTNLLLPELKANQPSLVLFTGSASSVLPTPYVATYAATKAYIASLSRSLQAEMILEGIAALDVTGCLIGNTISAGNPFDYPFFTLSSRDCARGCLDAAGYRGGFVYPHWKHAFHIAIGKYVPESRLLQMIGDVMRKRREEEEAKTQ